MHRFIVRQQLDSWWREAGHQILFLPKYSPDLNDIEHDFSALKRAIMYSHSATSLDEIIRAYCAT